MNSGHYKILQQGYVAWNEWREDNHDEIPDFVKANLRGRDLSFFNMFLADLRGSVLSEADCTTTNFARADLREADFSRAILESSNFRKATLTGAVFNEADLRGAGFRGADLRGANLICANLCGADLLGANLTGAYVGSSLFDGDLSEVEGLEQVVHMGPSVISVNSLLSFTNEIPETFLRGCGIREEEIAYFRGQIGKPIRFYTCFISYSTADEEFASRLHNDFQAAGIRCWKWDKDAKTGKSIWGEIDHAIRDFNKLVLIASESSLKSPAVIGEIERAIQKEHDLITRKNSGDYDGETDVLFPVRLDDYILDGWEHERKADVVKKVIADARGWGTDPALYARVRDKLIEDLKT